MNRTDMTAYLVNYNGELVTVSMADGTEMTGVLTNLNTKGVGFKMSDEDTRAERIAVTKIASIMPAVTNDDLLTTAEFAAIFDTNAKALRVQLRRLGLGVGKGHRYGLPRSLATVHGDAIRTGLAEDAAKKAS